MEENVSGCFFLNTV